MVWIHVAYFAFGTVPVTVTFPPTTLTLAPYSRPSSDLQLILPVNAGSAAAGVATGSGLQR